MNARKLIITPKVFEDLQISQVDAIELAGIDCSYDAHETDLTPEMLHLMNSNPCWVAVCTPADYQMLLRDQFGKQQLGGSVEPTPRGLVLMNMGEAGNDPLRPYLPLNNNCYTIGNTTPMLLRGLFGSVLEFHLGLGHRGVLPRLASSTELEIEKRTLTSSAERAEVQQFVTDFSKSVTRKHRATAAHGSQLYNKSMGDILDELLMNAIWDANPEFRNRGRTEVCELEPGKEVEIECSCDGVNLALTVEDKQGTLPPAALQGPLSYALGMRPQLKVNEGPGGAGLGLYMILQKTSIVSFEFKPGAYTRVTTVLRLDESAREMQARPKTLLIFQDTSGSQILQQ